MLASQVSSAPEASRVAASASMSVTVMAGCALRGHEWILDATVQLVGAHLEPHPTPGGQHRWLRDLGQPDEGAIERPQRVLTARRAGDLDVMEANDAHAAAPFGRCATAKIRRKGKITPIGVRGYAARSLSS